MMEQMGGADLLSDRETRLCTLQDVMERVEATSDLFPDLPIFDVVRRFFNSPKELCLTAVVDPWVRWCLDVESACEKYGVLPYEGGWFDQPEWVILLFDEIRSVRNSFESGRMNELRTNVSSGGGTKQASSSKPKRGLLTPPSMPHHPREHNG